MKILDLCEFFSERGGGVRSYLTKLGHAAMVSGHEVVVLAPGERDEETTHGGLRIVRYGAPRMPYDPTYFWPWRIDRMWNIVRTERPDVLQVSSPFLPALVAMTARNVPIKAYVHHSDPIGCYLVPAASKLRWPLARSALLGPAWAYMRSVCRACDVTVVAAEFLAVRLKQQHCQGVVTVPFGIAHGDFGLERRDPELRAALLGRIAANPDARLLLVAGRLASDKRQQLLVEAIRRVAQDRPVGLVVLGDGPERERLERAARDIPGGATFLRFTQNRAHYAAILASADALVHGSLCETYGFVLAEALASGTPLVVPDAGGAAAMADPSCSERYRALGNPAEVARAIERLLERPADDLREAARRAGLRQPSLSEHFDRLFALYRTLLGSGRVASHRDIEREVYDSRVP